MSTFKGWAGGFLTAIFLCSWVDNLFLSPLSNAPVHPPFSMFMFGIAAAGVTLPAIWDARTPKRGRGA